MSWINFQEQAFDLTEKEVKHLEREIIQQYIQAQKEIKKELKNAVAKIPLKSGTSGFYNELIKFNRLDKLLDTITKSYADFSRNAGKLTSQSGAVSATNLHYRKLYANKWLASDLVFSLFPDEMVEFITLGTIKSWKKITLSMEKKYGKKSIYQPPAGSLSSFLIKNRINEVSQIRQSITQGFIQGKSVNKISNDVASIIGKTIKTEAGIGFTGAKASAIKIVRTEKARVMNSAAQAASEFAKSSGIDIEKQWLATLDLRTRNTHASLDRTRIAIDENFTIGSDRALHPGGFRTAKNNANCRCSMIDIIDGKDPELRRGRNPVTGKTEVFHFKDFDQWAKDEGLKYNKSGRLVKA